jgi:hypothetical protein
MTEYLLKRALPFSLTFIIGAAVGGFFNLFGAGDRGPRTSRYTYTYEGGRSCAKKFRRHHLVAETRSPIILFKPDALYPSFGEGAASNSARVRVTFGADGKVQGVEQLPPLLSGTMLKAVERAARHIRFIPATVEGVPTTVTEEVEIHLSAE